MASGDNLEFVVLNELGLSQVVVSVFEALGFDMLTIIRISKDELENALLTSENSSWTQRDIDEIFGRLVRWRQMNGYEILDFTKVEVEEFWIEEPGETLVPIEGSEAVFLEEKSSENSPEEQADFC